jgi:Flp pilus assembly CpaE family ATPase
VLALDTRESVASLRRAIEAGASGYFLWPNEREGLLRAAAAAVRRPRHDASRGTLIGVHGGRGGVGVTYVATRLAAALARRGSAILIDADPVFGDVGHTLGAPPPDDEDAQPVHTLSDAVSLGEDLHPEQLRGALWRHDTGVDVLLAPSAEDAIRIGADDLRIVVDAAVLVADAVVLHLPRHLGAPASVDLDAVDHLVEVVTLDVASFRAASRTVDALAPASLGDRLSFVVNRAARSEITPGDVERVFGRPAAAVLPTDRSARSSGGRPAKIAAAGRTARRFDALAATLVEPVEADETAS